MCFGLSDHLLISTWQILAVSEIKGADAALDLVVSPRSTLSCRIALGQGENGCCRTLPSKTSRWDPHPFSPCTKFTQTEEPTPQMFHYPREPMRQSQEPHRSPPEKQCQGAGNVMVGEKSTSSADEGFVSAARDPMC